MPVSVVVGGQFGSEGKGKVALDLVRRDPRTTMVIRPGGTNSGHTGYSVDGRRFVLRQIPAAAIDGNVKVIFPAGSYIDVDLLLKEIADLGLSRAQVLIDPRAHIIRAEHIEWETQAGLVRSIGSTSSGTGAAVMSRIARYAKQHPTGMPATDVAVLDSYLTDTSAVMSSALAADERILIEGTQGFGLSVLHTDNWPKCTSRDTTAAGFLSEAGLSPLHVDQIVLVLRCHPIRVAGDSGRLPNETTWETIAVHSGSLRNLEEFTSVTHKLRRVGQFDAEVVKRAIKANHPTHIVLNHLDYVDADLYGGSEMSAHSERFVSAIEHEIGRRITWVGTGESTLVERLPIAA